MKKISKQKLVTNKADGDKSLVFKIAACFALFVVTVAIIVVTWFAVNVWFTK